MSNIFALTKVLIKNNVFSFSGRKTKGKSVSTKGSAIGFTILMIACALMIGLPIIFTLNDLLKSYELSELVLSFAIPVGGLTSVIFGIFSIISVFYFSKDSEQLLPLPIKSSELLISKFLASLVTEYLMLVMFIFPIIIGVGVGSGASFLYYLYSLIIFILMPIIPSVLMSIILMLANKAFNFGKRKDLFMYIMTGLILIFSFTYSFGLQYFLNSSEDEAIIAMLSGDFSGPIKISHYLFPFFNSATYSLVHSKEFLGFASLVTFIGLNLVSLVVLYFVGERLYIKGLTKDSGNNSSKHESLSKIYKDNKGGVIKELIKKEWLTIKRSPVFMLNVVIVNLIFPVIFGISFFMSFRGEGGSFSTLSSMINFNDSGVLFIAIGALLFLGSMSCATSSGISREGSSAWMMKIIPISLKKQLDAKVYFSMIIDSTIILALEIILMIVLNVPWFYIIIVNVPLFLMLLISNYLSLILDLRKPRLDWKEENEAVKQNFNVFISMLANIVVSVLFIVVGVSILGSNFNIYLAFALLSVVLLIGFVVMNVLISKNQSKLFNKVG